MQLNKLIEIFVCAV